MGSFRRLVLLLLLAFGQPLHAEQLRLALYGQRDEISLRSDSAEIDTRVSLLGLTINGIYTPHLEASLDLGRSWLTQSGNPATQGMELSGQFVGVAVRVWPLRGSHLDAWVQGDYGVYSFSGSSSGQKTDIDWYDGGLSAGLVAHLGMVDLHAGARHGSLNGDEIASGVMSYTRSIRLEDKNSVWVGMELHVDQSGSIGVWFENGSHRGVSLRFAHRY